MNHLPGLIEDLGYILMTAALVTLIFRRLHQPIVLGYLVVGFLLGPNVPLFPTIKDTANIKIWAEIGVIFMLFGLGLEFSFKKLTKVGKSATITATFEIISMLGVGYVAGQFLGWSKMDSIFLGGILSISSTTIIVRAFDELRMKGQGFVALVFGVLIVEDLLAILILVLLSSVALTQSLSGSDLIFTSLRLAFFLVIWFLLGIYLLPALLNKFQKDLTDETTLIIAIGLCLMMVIVASQIGFSPALGAFVMGSILAETRQGRKIEHLIVPVKDLFSAVFFVSVGMLLDPKVLGEYYGVILLMTAVTIIGKFLSSAIGALISGESLRTSVKGGLSLAQIGEFSFIIATLGMTLKVTSDFLYPIAVAISAMTTFTTPYLIKYSENIYQALERRLPHNVRIRLQRYESIMSERDGQSALSLFWREYGIKLLLNSVVIIAITLTISRFALPMATSMANGSIQLNLIACGLALIIASPFLWAVFIGGPSHIQNLEVSKVKRLQHLQLGIMLFRILLGSSLAAFIVSQFTSVLAFTGVIFVIIATLGALFFSRYSDPIYRRIEGRFLSNLSANERLELEEKAKIPELAPWQGRMAEFTVSSDSSAAGLRLQDLRIKEHYGATVAMIERGSRRIVAPTRNDQLFPHDKVYMIATDEQLARVREMLEKKIEATPSDAKSVGLVSVQISAEDSFANKSIKECGIRDSINGLIVGIERDGQRIVNPDADLRLLPGDKLLVVGDIERIKDLKSGLRSADS